MNKYFKGTLVTTGLILGVGLLAPASASASAAEVQVKGDNWFNGDGVPVCDVSDGGESTCGGQAYVGGWDGCENEPGIGGCFQCVELAQRFYKDQGWHAGVFSGVASARQIYTNATNLGMKAKPNDGKYSPVPGDMIIHNGTLSGSGGHGHVAIVNKVVGSTVHVVEQNWGASGTATYQLSSNNILSRDGNSSNIAGYVHDTDNTNTNNNPPNAHFTHSPIEAFVNMPVTFDGSGSSDEDGTIINYRYEYGDGDMVHGVTPHRTHTYDTPGNKVVTLTVKDNKGAVSTQSKTIKVIDVDDTIVSTVVDDQVMRAGIGIDQKVYFQLDDSTNWQHVGGGKLHSMTIASDGDNAYLAAIGPTSQAVYVNVFDGTAWSGWTNQSGHLIDVDIALDNTGAPMLVGIGTDEKIWTRTVGGGTWSRNIGGGAFTSVETTFDDQNVYVVGISKSKTVWTTSHNGSTWANWAAQSGRLLEVDIALTPNGQPFLVGRGTDEKIWTRPVSQGTWSRAIGGGKLANIEIAYDDSTVYVVGVSSTGSTWGTSYNGNSWSNWLRAGSNVAVGDIDILVGPAGYDIPFLFAIDKADQSAVTTRMQSGSYYASLQKTLVY